MSAILRIGILGGTFNPVHLGHINAANTAKDALRLEEVILIPSKTPPHKELPENSPDAEKRLAMLKIAVKGHAGLSVSDIELRRDGLSYTADTIDEFWDIPGCEAWLLVGTDMFLTLHNWYNIEQILNHAFVGVFSRETGDTEAIKTQKKFLEDKFGVRIEIIPNTVTEISSSELRRLLKDGKGKEFLPDGVFEYIKENGIYGI